MLAKVFTVLFFLTIPYYLVYLGLQRKLPLQLQPIIAGDHHLSISITMPFEPLSIDKIFSDNHSWTNGLPAEKKRVLIATGDVLLARTVNYKTVTNNNYAWPFEKIAYVLNSADITFINLETPLTQDCPLTNEGMLFCGNPGNIEGLLFAGVDIVNLANNHASDHGLSGVNSTTAFLNDAGLGVTGISGPVYKEVNGIMFAFLGYDAVDYQKSKSFANQQKIITEVSQAKLNADFVIVQFHWGNEYTASITPNQTAAARLAIDSGAELIIGNHPHWIQPVEIYKGKLITYSHGNFVFDQEWSLKTKQGIIGKYTFYENRLVDAEFLPVQIENYGQPYLLSGDTKKDILTSMKLQSEILTSTSH